MKKYLAFGLFLFFALISTVGAQDIPEGLCPEGQEAGMVSSPGNGWHYGRCWTVHEEVENPYGDKLQLFTGVSYYQWQNDGEIYVSDYGMQMPAWYLRFENGDSRPDFIRVSYRYYLDIAAMGNPVAVTFIEDDISKRRNDKRQFEYIIEFADGSYVCGTISSTLLIECE